MKPLPRLFHGQLVRFAKCEPEDAALFARSSEDGEYRRWMDTSYALPSNIADNAASARQFLADGGIVFHLRTLADDTLIGFLAIHGLEWNNQSGVLSMGIIDPSYRGQGYGSDALRLGLNYAFYELNLYRLGLEVNGDNARAIHTYEKVGFRREGIRRSLINRDGVRIDQLLMSILRDEYLNL